MAFSVNPQALDSLRMALTRRATELATTSRYLQQHAVIRSDGTAVAVTELAQVHARVVPALLRTLTTGSRQAQSRAAALGKALRWYTAADRSSAEALDAAVPLGVHHGRLPAVPSDPAAGASAFDTGWVAATQLRFPPDYRVTGTDPPSPYPASITGAQRRLIDGMSTMYPRLHGLATLIDASSGHAGEALSGDWSGVRTSAYAFDSAADATTTIQQSITAAIVALDTVWTGRAAAACATALQTDAGTLGQLAWTLHALARAYRPAGEAAHAVALAGEQLMAALADATVTGALGLGTEILTLPGLVEVAVRAADSLVHARHVARDSAATAGMLTARLAAA